MTIPTLRLFDFFVRIYSGCVLRVLVSGILLTCASQIASGQWIVYSGREYLQKGRSWFQLRQFDPATGRREQLTTTPADHRTPWCTPDGRSILFTEGAYADGKTLYRFDRATRSETRLFDLESALFSVAGSLDSGRIVLVEAGVIEIFDLASRSRVRRIDGSHVAISPDRQLLAWQTNTDLLALPRQSPHILLSHADGAGVVDLGEGEAPVFADGGRTLLYAQLNFQNSTVTLIRLDPATAMSSKQGPFASEFIRGVSLTVDPAGSSVIMAAGVGGNGSAVYWRLSPDSGWVDVDDNLASWGGWLNSRLVYSTSGHTLRNLDAQRTVWTGDIRIFDAASNSVRTLVSGISLNLTPAWCPSRP